ncbi:hypothetical protein BKA70DRAFT_1087678, partial [Coprinopsis sp. MPI-PUGE-AT-0042]
KAPSLTRYTNSGAPVIHPRLYAIPLTVEIMSRFVDRYCPHLAPVHDPVGKATYFKRNFASWVSTDIYQLAQLIIALPDGEAKTCLGVAIASNKTQQEFEKHKNRDLVTELHQVLGVDTEPGWYHFLPPTDR